jgi:hypothetical protein
MQKEHQQLPYQLLVSTLLDLCKLGKTGTMYISTDDNHAARFTLNHGEIVACGFSAKRGTEALELVRSINGGKYSFIESSLPAELKQNLSSTQEILDYLSMLQDSSHNPTAASISNQMDGESPVLVNPFSTSIDSPEFQQPPATQKKLGLKPEKRKVDIPNPDDLMELLQEELALYIGPLGPAVCNIHAEKILQISSSEELSKVIDLLSQEVGSQNEAQAFQNGVWARLS